MSRRIEVELTSTREDGTWTWRAAGAKLPKGELNGSLLFAGAKVGDVVRADAEQMLDGIEILSVVPPKGARKEAERIQVIGTPRRDDEPLVTTKLAPKGRGDRRERRPRRDGDERGGRRDDSRERRPRREGEGGGSQDARRKSGDREHSNRPPRPTKPAPERPKAKRLRASRIHRNAVLAALPAEQKPVAEQVLRGGVPAVRQALEKQNEERKAAGEAPVPTDAIIKMAEDLTPSLRAAEWRDKAEAALSDMDELDLRDLRSVVVAADAGARDDESRELADKLRSGLAARVESEQAAWLAEIAELLAGGRAVRALRVSSRPPKAGAPLPADLAAKLAEGAAASLTAETGQDRYATVLDALAYSPVRAQVVPQGIPAEPSEQLLAAVRKVATRLPEIATRFGIDASTPKARKPRPPKPPVATTEAEGAATTSAAPAPEAPAPVAVEEAPEAASDAVDAPAAAGETISAALPEAEGDSPDSDVAVDQAD